MNAKKFSDAMSELDNKYIDEAINYKKKVKKSRKKTNKHSLIKWGAMAACLCLIVAGAFTLPHFQAFVSISNVTLLFSSKWI